MSLILTYRGEGGEKETREWEHYNVKMSQVIGTISNTKKI